MTGHIFFGCDDNYIKYCAVSIASIVLATQTSSISNENSLMGGGQINSNAPSTPKNSKDSHSTQNLAQSPSNPAQNLSDITNFHFHIIYDSISPRNLTKLRTLESNLNEIFPLSISLHQITSEDFSDLTPWGEKGNFSAYFRLKLGDFIDSSMEKILYLDTDIIALSDVREIFGIDLGENFAAVVRNSVIYDEKRLAHFLMPPSKIESYFNSGVMLINTKRFKTLNLSQIKSFPRGGLPDQDFLNYMFGENIKLLDFSWNLQWIDERFLHFSNVTKAVKNTTKALAKIPKNPNKKPPNLEIMEAKILESKDICAYSYEEFSSALKSPKLVHFIIYKPWHKYMMHQYSYIESSNKFITHPLANEWFKIARKTTFYKDIMLFYYKAALRFALGFYIRHYMPRFYGILKKIKSLKTQRQ